VLFFELFPLFMLMVSVGAGVMLFVIDRQARQAAAEAVQADNGKARPPVSPDHRRARR
jgi:hypothetical protein